MPIFSTLVSLFVIQVMLSGEDSDDFSDVIEYAFPFYAVFSLVSFSGLYIVSTVQDRELGLRYILNLTGVRPSAYYLGLALAECVIFTVSNAVLIIISGIVGATFFFKASVIILPATIFASLPFILLNQLLGMIYDKSETAFKWHPLMLLLSIALTWILFLFMIENYDSDKPWPIYVHPLNSLGALYI